jgi:hypothetical protein
VFVLFNARQSKMSKAEKLLEKKAKAKSFHQSGSGRNSVAKNAKRWS